MRQIEGLQAVIDDYDGFAIDQWGVLHDGKALYPGVLELLERLNEDGKDVRHYYYQLE